MRILYTNFHRQNGGGHDTYLLGLIAALAQDHEITVAAPGSSRLFGFAATIPGVRAAGINHSARGAGWWREYARLRRLICEGGFDIIHVNGSADHRLVMLATLTLPRRPRIVFTKHNDHPCTSLGNALRAWLATDDVIAVSDYVAGQLSASPYCRRRITVIRHGVDTDHFAPPSRDAADAIRARYFGVAWRDKIVLGSTAGTSREKGWLDLLGGMARLPVEERDQFRVLIAGQPPSEALRSQVAAMGLADCVVFTGLLDDVRPVLAASDVAFVLSHRETLSYACREAMAMGRPVLISRTGGLPENVNHGVDGWIVPARDPDAVCAVLKQMLAAPAKVETMGHAACSKSQAEFVLAPAITATLAIYGEVPLNSYIHAPEAHVDDVPASPFLPAP